MTGAAVVPAPDALPTVVLLGDELVPATEARISPFDRGFLFGDGVYEMVRTFDRRPVAMDAHVARLRRGLVEIGITGFDAGTYASIVDRLLDAEGLADAGVYLQVTRGVEIPRRHVPGDIARPTVFAYATPLPPLDALATIERSALVLVPDDRWHRPDIKSLNLLANVLAASRAHDLGADEAVLHRHGLVSEGSHSSIVAIVDDVLVAPTTAAAPSILPGTMRPLVFAAARELGLAAAERPLRVEDLRRASEIGVASSRRLLHEAASLDGRPVPGGPWMARLLDTMVRSIRSAPPPRIPS